MVRRQMWAALVVALLCVVTSAGWGRKLARPQLIVQDGPWAGIEDLAWSLDGRFLVSRDLRRTQTWDVRSGFKVAERVNGSEFSTLLVLGPEALALSMGSRLNAFDLARLERVDGPRPRVGLHRPSEVVVSQSQRRMYSVDSDGFRVLDLTGAGDSEPAKTRGRPQWPQQALLMAEPHTLIQVGEAVVAWDTRAGRWTREWQVSGDWLCDGTIGRPLLCDASPSRLALVERVGGWSPPPEGARWDFGESSFQPMETLADIQSYTAPGPDSVVVLDAQDGEVRLRCGLTGTVDALALSPSGGSVAVLSAGELWILGIPEAPETSGDCRKWVQQRAALPTRLGVLRYAPDGQTLALGAFSGEGQALTLFDVSDLRVRRALGRGEIPWRTRLSGSATGDTLIALGGLESEGVDLWDLAAGSRLKTAEAGRRVIGGVAGAWVATVEDGVLTFTAQRGTSLPRSEPLIDPIAVPPGAGWLTDAQGLRFVAADVRTEGFAVFNQRTTELLYVDLHAGTHERLPLALPWPCHAVEISLSPSGDAVWTLLSCLVEQDQIQAGWVRWTLGEGALEPLTDERLFEDGMGARFASNGPAGQVAYLSNGAVMVRGLAKEDGDEAADTDGPWGEEVRVLPHSLGGVEDLSLSEDGRWLFLLMRSGVIEVHEVREWASYVASLVPVDEGYAIVLESGVYKATPGALGAIALVDEAGELLSATWADALLNRPDRVVEAFGHAPEALVQRYATQLKDWQRRMGVEVDDADTGAIELPEPLTLSLQASRLSPDGRVLTLEGLRVEPTAPAAVEVTVNGVRQPLPLQGGREDSGGWTLASAQVPLLPGRNRVELRALDSAGGRSRPERVELVAAPPETAPKVWFVGLAAERYAKLGELTYAEDDVAALWAGLVEVGVVPEGNPEPLYFIGAALTPEVLQEVRAYVAQAAPQDIVIVHASGHGIVGPGERWYFATPEADPDRPEQTAIAYRALVETLAETPAQARLMLLDACNSGPPQRTLSEAEAQALGRKGVVAKGGSGRSATPPESELLLLEHDPGDGVVVLAAAGGAELAWETAEARGGLFTGALLKGLRGLRADANGDSSVDVAEWVAFARQEVELVSDGYQRPVARSQSLGVEFVVVQASPPSWSRSVRALAELPEGGEVGVVAIDPNAATVIVGQSARWAPPEVLFWVTLDGAEAPKRLKPPSHKDAPLYGFAPQLQGEVLTMGFLTDPAHAVLLSASPGDARWARRELAWGPVGEPPMALEGSVGLGSVSWPLPSPSEFFPGGNAPYLMAMERPAPVTVIGADGALVARWTPERALVHAHLTGAHLLTVDAAGTLRQVRLSDGAVLRTYSGLGGQMSAHSANERYVLMVTDDERWLQIDLSTPSGRVRALKVDRSIGGLSAAIADDGAIIGVVGEQLVRWDAW